MNIVILLLKSLKKTQAVKFLIRNPELILELLPLAPLITKFIPLQSIKNKTLTTRKQKILYIIYLLYMLLIKRKYR
jgi:hypothetical protein